MCCAGAPAEVLSNIPDLGAPFYFDYPQGQGPWFTCAANGEMPPRMAKQGYAGDLTPAATLPQLMMNAASGKKKDKDALCVERPCPPLGSDGKPPPPKPRREWKTWTVKTYHDDVRKLAKAFIKFGFKQFDTVNIWGFNSPEWFISAMAGMYCGGKTGGIYPTDTMATAGYKVMHSGGVVACVENKDHISKINTALNELKTATKLKAFVAWGFQPAAGETVAIEGCGDVPVHHFDAALAVGAAEADDAVSAAVAAIKPGHCAALIYTSGTTGDPKAVMVSHDNINYTSNVVFGTLADSCGMTKYEEEERVLSYLPLSHVAGMTVDLTGQVIINALTPANNVVFFARPYDLKVGAIKDRLAIARPTAFLGVPLVWEKMADKIRAIGQAGSGVQQKISGWAKAKMLEHAKNIVLGGDGSKPCNWGMANKLMMKVKGAVGLDKSKFACTGAAPIRVDTLEYYGSLGIYINEMYGMSESTAAASMSTDQAHQWGSCGWQTPGTQTKIFRVDPSDLNIKTECPRAPSLSSTEDEFQGEICFRGRCIMMGYMSCPDMGASHVEEIEKKTGETIDSDGWLHSGDKGLKTKAGMIKITGRYKELIIGAGGENIAPVPIEDSVKGIGDAVMECMMVGDKRKYNIALITLKAVGANGETPGTDELDAPGKRVDPKITKISQAMQEAVFIDYIKNAVNKTNANPKICPNNTFTIKKFTIMPDNFSEERGELTPTKKLKRGQVEKSYKELIDHIYDTEGMYIPFKKF